MYLLVFFCILPFLHWILNPRSCEVILTGKSYLITGAANGLGKAITLKIAEIAREKHQRLTLHLIDKDLKKLDELKCLISETFADIEINNYRCDLSQAKELEKLLFTELKEVNIDVIINNAGTSNNKIFLNIDDISLRKTVQVNFLSHIQIIRHFLPKMLAQKDTLRPAIVGIHSVMSFLPSAYLTDYCSSKAASFAFYDCLRQEVGSKIDILSVCPYVLRTRMFYKGFDLKQEGNTIPVTIIERIREFLFPVLDEKYVAKEVLVSLSKGKKVVFIYPILKYLIFIMKLLPTSIFDFALKLGCTEQAMRRLND